MEYGTQPAPPSESNGAAWFMLANNPSVFFSLVNTTAGFCFSCVILIQIIFWLLIWWEAWGLGVWYVNRSRGVSYNQCFVCKVGQRWDCSTKELPVSLGIVLGGFSGAKEGPTWKCVKGHHSMLPRISHGCVWAWTRTTVPCFGKGETIRLCGEQRKETSLL